MKKVFTKRIAQMLMLAILFSACNKSLVEKNGLTKEINDVIPEEILNILDSLEMPIHRGGNPPMIEGTFLASQRVLFSSNRKGDIKGRTFVDEIITFSNENLEKLEIITAYNESNITEFEGLGSYIVGEEDQFSVFVMNKEYRTGKTDSVYTARIFSGLLTNDGISSFYETYIMLDDYGDPNNRYIEIGDARVLIDEDGLAENYSEDKSLLLDAGKGVCALDDCEESR